LAGQVVVLAVVLRVFEAPLKLALSSPLTNTHTHTRTQIPTQTHKLFAAYQRVGRCPFLWPFCFVFVCFSYLVGQKGGGWVVGDDAYGRWTTKYLHTHTDTKKKR